MFQSEAIFVKNGPLAKIWLACHWERKLSKLQYINTNIPTSIDCIKNEMQIRIQSQLLLGIVKIYSKKTKYLLEDCNDALVKLKMNLKPGLVNLRLEQTTATNTAITLNMNEILNTEPILDLNALFGSQESKRRDTTSFSLDSTLSEMEVGRDALQSRLYSPAPSREGDGILEDILGDKGALDFGFDDNGDLGFGADLDIVPETEHGLNLSRKESNGGAALGEEFSDLMDLGNGY